MPLKILQCSFSFRDIYPDKIISAETLSYDTYFDKTQNQSPETVAAAESGSSATWTSVLLNQTILENPDDFVASIVKMWIPRCYSTGTDYTTPCTLGYLMHLTLPRHDDEVSGLLLTEGGTYPKLLTQPKNFVHCSN